MEGKNMPDVTEMTITDMHEKLTSFDLSAEEATTLYIDRIESYSKVGPNLNAVREVNPDALSMAAGLDRERREGQIRSRLHGVPVLLKDNMATGDKMTTTVGVRALERLRTPFDAAIVRRLRAAGAVILGKCNCPDFCDYMSSTMPSEHSTTGGPIGHPYGLKYGRGGGSSTGVASAVATSMAAAGIGSETQNSIQAPCCNSAVVGIKPTVGLVSRAGIVPLAVTQDTAGPIARTVRDAAILLSAIAGPDPDDTITLTCLGAVKPDYSVFCVDSALVGARIGVARAGFFGREGKAEIDACVDGAITSMHEAGAVIVDPADIPTAGFVMPLASRVFRTDFKVGLNEFLRRCGDRTQMRRMRDIVDFNEANGSAAAPFGQDLLVAAEGTAGDWSEPEYHADRARDLRLCREEGIDHVLRSLNLDAICVPMDHAAKLTGKAGYPAVSVPCGFLGDGAPVGITFIGTAWSEPKLIAIAYAFERTTMARKPPHN
jgi:amidase